MLRFLVTLLSISFSAHSLAAVSTPNHQWGSSPVGPFDGSSPHCDTVLFNTPWSHVSEIVSLQVAVDHANWHALDSSQHRDSTYVWVEDVGVDSFVVCVKERYQGRTVDMAHQFGLNIAWWAIATDAPAGTIAGSFAVEAWTGKSCKTMPYAAQVTTTTVECQEVKPPMDIWFADDNSGSVDSSEFAHWNQFVANVSGALDYSPTYTSMQGAQTGLWIWADTNDQRTIVSPHVHEDAMWQANLFQHEVTNYNRRGGGTDIADALEYGYEFINTERVASNHPRAGVPQVIFFATDASPYSQVYLQRSRIAAAASAIKNLGVTIVIFYVASPSSYMFSQATTVLRDAASTVGGQRLYYPKDRYHDISEADALAVTELFNTVACTKYSETHGGSPTGSGLHSAKVDYIALPNTLPTVDISSGPTDMQSGKVAWPQWSQGTQCQTINYPNSFANDNINVQITVDHMNSNPASCTAFSSRSDATYSWVENIQKTKFTVCIEERYQRPKSLMGHDAGLYVSWVAATAPPPNAQFGEQPIPSWSGTHCESIGVSGLSSVSQVLVTINHRGESLVHDPSTAWVENISSTCIRVCMKEPYGYDDHHAPMHISWMAFAGASSYGAIVASNSITSPGHSSSSPLCFPLPYQVTTNSAIVVASVRRASAVQPYGDAMTHWLETVSSTSAEVCVQEQVGMPEGIDAVTVDYIVIPYTTSTSTPVVVQESTTPTDLQSGRRAWPKWKKGTHCEVITFPTPFSGSHASDINVQITVDHAVWRPGCGSPAEHEATYSWIEWIETTGFRVCVRERHQSTDALMGHDTGLNVAWTAATSPPTNTWMGEVAVDVWQHTYCSNVAFPRSTSTLPNVVASINHRGQNIIHHASTVWLENVTECGFRFCLREDFNYDQWHLPLNVAWMAFLPGTHTGGIVHSSSVDLVSPQRPNQGCVSLPFPETNGAIVLATPRRTSPAVPQGPSMTHWIEEVTNTSARMCVHAHAGLDAFSAEYVVIAGTPQNAILASDSSSSTTQVTGQQQSGRYRWSNVSFSNVCHMINFDTPFTGSADAITVQAHFASSPWQCCPPRAQFWVQTVTTQGFLACAKEPCIRAGSDDLFVEWVAYGTSQVQVQSTASAQGSFVIAADTSSHCHRVHFPYADAAITPEVFVTAQHSSGSNSANPVSFEILSTGHSCMLVCTDNSEDATFNWVAYDPANSPFNTSTAVA